MHEGQRFVSAWLSPTGRGRAMGTAVDARKGEEKTGRAEELGLPLE